MLVFLVAAGCATTERPAGDVKEGTTPVVMTRQQTARAEPRVRPMRAPDVELFFKGEEPWARRGAEEWPLGDVKKDEMAFSPDHKRFAYVREKQSPRGPAPARVLVRNLAGDPINEFAVYRPGKIDELIWLDNRRLGYLSPASDTAGKKTSPVYVVHDVNTGEIIAARASSGDFIWGPSKRHVAFVSGQGPKQQVVVDGQGVWPRYGVTRVHATPVWSPDGHGLAFTEEGPKGPRLIVLVEFDDAQGDLTWAIPKDALSPSLRVFWAGDSKVVIGESTLKPRFAADWQRLR